MCHLPNDLNIIIIAIIMFAWCKPLYAIYYTYFFEFFIKIIVFSASLCIVFVIISSTNSLYLQCHYTTILNNNIQRKKYNSDKYTFSFLDRLDRCPSNYDISKKPSSVNLWFYDRSSLVKIMIIKETLPLSIFAGDSRLFYAMIESNWPWGIVL